MLAAANDERKPVHRCMQPASEKVVALRRLLDVRFPTAPRAARRIVPTGVPQIDELLHGGLVSGGLTELVSSVPSGGSQLTLGSLILSTREARQRIAIVDAAGTFDLEGLDDDALSHLVWVRCSSLSESWRATDLLARDPNFSVVAIDVRGFPARELMRTRDSVWVRLQRAAEQADTAIAVQSATSIVPNAGARLLFTHTLGDTVHMQRREGVVASIMVELQRSRVVREVAS